MSRFSPVFRIALSLTLVTISVLLTLDLFKILPDPRREQHLTRISRSEATAMRFALMTDGIAEVVSSDETDEVKRHSLNTILKPIYDSLSADPEFLSLGVRGTDGTILIDHNRHDLSWADHQASGLDGCIAIPIFHDSEKWADLEIRYSPLIYGIGRFFNPTLLNIIGVGCPLMMLLFLFNLRRVMKRMGASQAVPEHVREAFGTFAEGVVVLDPNSNMVLTNTAFENIVKLDPAQLLGKNLSEIEWKKGDSKEDEHPWIKAIRSGSTCMGNSLKLELEGATRTFMVNASPILDDRKAVRGCLVSFEDITDMEERKQELLKLLEILKQSREEIRLQNEELRFLATRDPLTGCFNRRSFFEQFETNWKGAERYSIPLCVIMVDIDHFKSINDNFGHHMGDVVLKTVGEALRNYARDVDIVCRYGGEEFAVLLPHTDIEAAVQVAERFRQEIGKLEFPNLKIAASLGVAAKDYRTADPQGVINEADKCLYVAKRNGRNQVVRRDLVPDDLIVDESKIKRTKPTETPTVIHIPYHAVSCLIAALSYRDNSTAEHSRRVADMCVAVGSKIMSNRDVYVLEIAALLHDIGKIGVPDAVLLKPGPLTQDEWKIMERHDVIGVEIVRSSFSCTELTSIVEHHHSKFSGDPKRPQSPKGDEIPLGARILTIADAFDAMVSDRIYRKGRSIPDALAELRKCAGTQFDPELVEIFEHVVLESQSRLSNPFTVPNRESALQIGLEIERIAEKLDSQDGEGLRALAGRLRLTATRNGIPEIAQLAEEIECLPESKTDFSELVGLTRDLLSICRSTQRAFLAGDFKTEHSLSGVLPSSPK